MATFRTAQTGVGRPSPGDRPLPACARIPDDLRRHPPLSFYSTHPQLTYCSTRLAQCPVGPDERRSSRPGLCWKTEPSGPFSVARRCQAERRIPLKELPSETAHIYTATARPVGTRKALTQKRKISRPSNQAEHLPYFGGSSAWRL